jgi:hypothetical protein
MLLHIVVRHRNNPYWKYPNEWLDESRIKSIVTYASIAEQCKEQEYWAKPVRIHRLGDGRTRDTICCECEVKSIDPFDCTYFRVEFTNARVLSLQPYASRPAKQSSYFAAPPDEPRAASPSAQQGVSNPTESAADSDAAEHESESTGDSVTLAFGQGQRDKMRELVGTLGRNQAIVCNQYAVAETLGLVPRTSNKYGLTPQQYADALWRDGIRKGWL